MHSAGDLGREGAEYRIVDHRGDYPKISNERVVAPGENLGSGQRYRGLARDADERIAE
jgi:hypothetical protein